MACINLDAIRKLEETKNVDCYVDGVQILLNLLENVIREPENPKYRTIRLENKTIKEKLLALVGARELLIRIGFHEVSKHYFDILGRFLIVFCFSLWLSGKSMTAN